MRNCLVVPSLLDNMSVVLIIIEITTTSIKQPELTIHDDTNDDDNTNNRTFGALFAPGPSFFGDSKAIQR